MAGTGEKGSDLLPSAADAREREPESEIRVLIVDDHQLVGESMASILREHGVDVVAIARSGRDAVALAKNERPDVVLMDIGLPDTDGINAGQQIMKQLPGTKLLAITGLESTDIVEDAMLSGFHGYLHKHAPSSELIDSIRLVVSGQAVMPQSAAQRLATRATGGSEPRDSAAARLSARERDVLDLLVQGGDTGQIAQRLFLSPNTVRTHVQNILAKLEVHSRLEAAAYAVRHGIVKAPDGRRTFDTGG